MKGLFALCVLACLGLWGWALYWPKPVETLPARFVGQWVWEGFEPPIAKNGKRVPMANPFPPGQHRRFTFRPDGTYLQQVLVAGENEMLRFEGFIRLLPNDIVEIAQISENRVKSETPQVARYKLHWGHDNKGEFLKLVQELETEEEKAQLKQGHERYLRPLVKGDGQG